MSKRAYRTAIIGLGAVGKRTLANMAAHPRFEPVAGYDTDSSALDGLAGSAPEFRLVANASTLFETGGIDLLYVATPPDDHAPAVLAGLERNWHILCEKPLGTDLAESEGLVHAMEGRDLFQGVNFVYSGAPAMRVAKDHIEAGTIGEVAGAELVLKFAAWPRGWQAHAEWLGRSGQGGMMREVGSHYAYLSREMFGELELGEPLIVDYPSPGMAETLVMAKWQYSGGTVTVDARVGGHRQDVVRYRILGSEGCLVFDNWYGLHLEKPDGWIPLLEPEEAEPISAYTGQLDQIALQLDDGRKRLADFADALAVQRLVEGML